MVNEKHVIPSVCILSVSALAAFYAAANLPFSRLDLMFVFIALVPVFAVISTLSSMPRGPTRNGRPVCIALCACFGVACGLVSAISLHDQRSPIESLAERNRVKVLSVSFLSDPVPWGPRFYSVPCAVRTLSCADGSIYSARGQCSLLLPAALVRSALPGGISGSNKKAVIFSSGLDASFEGDFMPFEPGAGEQFRASTIVPGSAGWHSTVDLLRASLRLSLMRILYDWKDAGGFLLALFSANRDYLNPVLAAEFKQTGLSHVLALSGMHLSLLALVTIKLGKRIGGKRLSIRLSTIAIVFFVWFAGVSPSLNRALIMALAMVAMKRLGFAPCLMPVLALAAFLQLLASPSDAFSLAFMLSYGALWGIVTFGEYALSLIPAKFRVYPSGDLAASIGATILTSPIIALTIGVIAPIGIIASCFASPLSSIFLVVGMALAGVSALLPPLSPLCGAIVTALYRVTVFPVHCFARIPPLSIHGLPATIAACFFPLLAGFLLYLIAADRRKRRSIDGSFARL
jgi:ComEC/Rec2-related protein